MLPIVVLTTKTVYPPVMRLSDIIQHVEGHETLYKGEKLPTPSSFNDMWVDMTKEEHPLVKAYKGNKHMYGKLHFKNNSEATLHIHTHDEEEVHTVNIPNHKIPVLL
jgi:hypothetical protein